MKLLVYNQWGLPRLAAAPSLSQIALHLAAAARGVSLKTPPFLHRWAGNNHYLYEKNFNLNAMPFPGRVMSAWPGLTATQGLEKRY